MSSANRSCSPVTKPTLTNRRTQELVLEEKKIHRIRLVSPALCYLSHMVSPNLVWFKLVNHVTKELQYTKPYELKSLESIAQGSPTQLKQFDYVMAPLEEKVYARARITSSLVQVGEPSSLFVYVHFIDEGHAAWMNTNCLAAMETSFYCHPWQAFPVALFKLSPSRNLHNLELDDQWPDDVNEYLEQILSEYEYFRVEPIPNAARVNTYYEYIRADVHGLTAFDDKEGESIAKRLALDMPLFQRLDEYLPFEFMNRRWYDACEQNLIDSETEKLTDEILAEIPKWRLRFPKDFANGLPTTLLNKKPQSEEEESGYDPDWDLCTEPNTYPSVKPCTIDTLIEKRCFVAGTQKSPLINMCVDWKSLKSPNEFFAFPLAENQSMEELYEYQQKWATLLDSFYGQPTNRNAILGSIVRKMFCEERKVFGMFEWNDEVTSGSYRRVEVLAVRNPRSSDYSSEFCRIRFIDVGGSDIVPLAGLLAIHSMHCKMPPLCLQMSIFTIKPPNGDTNWSEKSCRFFRQLARSDVFISCFVAGQNSNKSIVRYTESPEDWPCVVKVGKLRVLGVELMIEQQMIDLNVAQQI